MSTCPICLDDTPDFKLPNCKHMFHKDCINQWLVVKPICPLCRAVCINTFTHLYKKTLVKKGIVTVQNNALIFKHTGIFKMSCKPTYKIISLNTIKRIEYNSNTFIIIYIHNYRPKIKKIHTNDSYALFNLCKYYFYNSNRTLSI
mgnify:CR=1 FL=1